MFNFSLNSQRTGRAEKGESLLFFPNSFCVVDLETTGFDPSFDDIIEIGIIRVENGEIVDTFESLVYSDFLSPHITEITGITAQMLSTAPALKSVLPKALDFIGDNIVVGHNVSFDVNFLYDASERELEHSFKNDFVCTMRLFRRLHKELPHHRLCDMVEFYAEDNQQAHRALSDCYATFGCFGKMKAETLRRYGSESFPHREKRSRAPARTKTCQLVFDENAVESPDNLFKNKHCVFTGALSLMVRDEAVDLIGKLGGFADNSVTKKTDFLVIGNLDYCSTVKNGKSNKLKKAESLLESGQAIQIITENVFLDMLESLLKDESQEDKAGIEQRAFGIICKAAPELIKNNGHFELIENEAKTRTDFSSVKYIANSSVYRSSYDSSIIIATVKKKGKLQYVSFSDKFKSLFEKAQIPFSSVASESSVRIDVSDLDGLEANEAFSQIIEDIVLNSFSFKTFGCCSKYVACSDAKKCLHDDYFYASAACEYKKNLDAGKIFYGKNAEQ